MLLLHKNCAATGRWCRDATDRVYVWDAQRPGPRQRCAIGGAQPHWKPGLFPYSGNSGTYAIEAAALIGFTEIRMLGIDLRYDLCNSHFFGDGRKEGCRLSNPEQVLAEYRALHEKLAERGTKLVNESAYAGPLDEFIPREESPWLKT